MKDPQPSEDVKHFENRAIRACGFNKLRCRFPIISQLLPVGVFTQLRVRHAAEEYPKDVLSKILIDRETEDLLFGVGISR